MLCKPGGDPWLAALAATSKEKKWMCVGEEYIQGKHVFSPDFLLNIEEVGKYKSRIRLKERRVQCGVTETKARDLDFAST